jgi:hypothetical protein
MSGAGDSETSVDQHLAQRALPIGMAGGAPIARDHGVDQVRIVARKDAEGVADRHSRDRSRVRSKSTCQVSFSEPGLLSRVRERKRRFRRIVARAAGSPAGRAASLGIFRDAAGGPRCGALNLLIAVS